MKKWMALTEPTLSWPPWPCWTVSSFIPGSCTPCSPNTIWCNYLNATLQIKNSTGLYFLRARLEKPRPSPAAEHINADCKGSDWNLLFSPFFFLTCNQVDRQKNLARQVGFFFYYLLLCSEDFICFPIVDLFSAKCKKNKLTRIKMLKQYIMAVFLRVCIYKLKYTINSFCVQCELPVRY